MTAQTLPPNPDLDQLKRQAKERESCWKLRATKSGFTSMAASHVAGRLRRRAKPNRHRLEKIRAQRA